MLRPVCGTQKGDVYSFSIILQEILFRAMPYFLEGSSPKGQYRRLVKIDLDLNVKVFFCQTKNPLNFIFLNVKCIFMNKNVYTYHMKTLG